MKQKTVTVKAGQFKGKQALIGGIYKELFGHSIFHDSREPVVIDYMKRLALEPVSTLTETYFATIDGENVILNNYEITGKE